MFARRDDRQRAAILDSIAALKEARAEAERIHGPLAKTPFLVTDNGSSSSPGSSGRFSRAGCPTACGAAALGCEDTAGEGACPTLAAKASLSAAEGFLTSFFQSDSLP
jgi:hypothetical protein